MGLYESPKKILVGADICRSIIAGRAHRIIPRFRGRTLYLYIVLTLLNLFLRFVFGQFWWPGAMKFFLAFAPFMQQVYNKMIAIKDGIVTISGFWLVLARPRTRSNYTQ